MAPRFKTLDREQLMLLPPDLKEWIPQDDMVHFFIETAALVPESKFILNQAGTGDEQYHPHMMLALILYSYSHGFFSSRKIERLTWKDVSVRYLCANLHPDHDTICTFRVRNETAIGEAFLEVLKLAKKIGILKVGTVSVDGTKIKANASIHKSIRYDRAKELEGELDLKVKELMEKAKAADEVQEGKDENLNGDLARHEVLREKIRKAKEDLEKRASDKASLEKKTSKKKNNKKKDSDDGDSPQDTPSQPENKWQSNMTDSESRIMKKNVHSEYTQAYNGQAVVDVDGTMMVLGCYVTNNGTDRKELAKAVNAIDLTIGEPRIVLADNGYASEGPVQELQKKGLEVLVSVHSEQTPQKRLFDFRPRKEPLLKKSPNYQKSWVKEMAKAMKETRAKDLYNKRKCTVEPVFGIVKQAMGFRQFLLRGLEKVNLEWTLIMCAYNMKRLAVLSK